MRVLFATQPGKSIFQYLVPLAWALRTAGHKVRFASQPKFADVITQSGLTALPVGSDRDPWRLADWKPEVRAALSGGPLEPYDTPERQPEDISWEHMNNAYGEAVVWWHKSDNVPIIADLVAFVREWQPDLIIWEPTTYAGAIAAKACGAAHARLLFSLDIFGVTRDHYLRLKHQQPPENRHDPLAEWLGAYAKKYGSEFTEDLITGHFTIDQFPGSLQTEADLHYERMRYVPYGGPAVVPKWLWTPPERPRVAFTMGLSATERLAGYPIGMQEILDSLADLDVEIVATIAEKEQQRISRVPGNTRIVPYVPLHALVPTCSAVIHHAGAATLATTSLHGVPQLALHRHFDQPALARRLAEQGAGLAVPSELATGETVRANLLRLLNERAFGAAAIRLRDEMHALPTPNQLAPQLEELTTKYRVTPTPVR
jgi:glycosyltransferase (activator-dependent family)